MTREFNIIRLFVCLYVERVHRGVFDKQYRHDYKLTWRDRPILAWYWFMNQLFPEFRPYLRFWKPIIVRGYQLHKLTIPQQAIFWHIRNVNVERYSPYMFKS